MPSTTIFASSNPANGAVNTSTNGDQFSIYFNQPLDFRKAKSVQVGVANASFWYTIPNITTSGNQVQIIGPDTGDVGTTYNITVPQGLYSLDGINASIAEQLASAGAKIVDGPLIELIADYATNKVKIKFNYSTVTVQFIDPTSLGPTLGWAVDTVFGPHAVVPFTQTGASEAALNTVNGVLIHSDIAAGIAIGGRYNNTIAQLNIPANSIGKQVVYEPLNVIYLDTDPALIAELHFTITDELSRGIIMTEYWAVTLRFEVEY